MALLSEYGFKEGTGTTAADLSGNGHTITAMGGAYDVGNTTVEGATDANIGTNAYREFTPTGGMAKAISVYIDTLDGTNNNVQVGIYSDNGSGTAPLTRLVSSTPQLGVTGWNTINITPTPINPSVYYWIAFATAGVTSFRRGASSQNMAYDLTSAYPMPATFSADATSTDVPSFYMTLDSAWHSGGKNGFGAVPYFQGAMGPNAAQNAYTVMAWVKLTEHVPTGQGWGQIVHHVSDFWLEVAEDDVPDFTASNNLVADNPLTLNTWTHIAVTGDGTTIKMFINGSEQIDNAPSTIDFNFGTGTWQIATGGDGHFPGIVDEVRVFNTALTAGEITTWMNTPILENSLAWLKA